MDRGSMGDAVADEGDDMSMTATRTAFRTCPLCEAADGLAQRAGPVGRAGAVRCAGHCASPPLVEVAVAVSLARGTPSQQASCEVSGAPAGLR